MPSVDQVRIDWSHLVQLSSQHLVTPELARAIDEQRSLRVPASVTDYLKSIRRLNAKRNASAIDESLSIVREMNREGIRPLLLKGAGNLLTGVYPELASRVMTDIDMIVAPEEHPAARRVLELHGYVQSVGPYREEVDHHHGPPRVHASRRFRVELHRLALTRRCCALVPCEEAMATAWPVERDGIAFRVMSPTLRMIHLVAHCQLQNGHHAARVVELRNLVDAQYYVARFQEQLDWAKVAQRFEAAGAGAALDGFRLLARSLLGVRLGDDAPAALTAQWARFATGVHLGHPRLNAVVMRARLLSRLGRLPARLADPSWYGRKWRFMQLERDAGRRVLYGRRAEIYHRRSTDGKTEIAPDD
ncbi:MAG: nucleotidyltransferase family protein [Gammaproteobacteria bacterium]|nr:nucleotidyltransferase family protein [Gammaproteobacteria bacterium]